MHTVEAGIQKQPSCGSILILLMQWIRAKSLVLSCIFDLPAAVDTVNHDLLLDHLQHRFGIGGKVASWLKSYLVGKRQEVVIDSVFSESSTLQYGVP